ncbi:M20/M25/M40 family metallo-hydrolase [Streptomyces sp. NPDC058691]|uniref:M20/M25/M40 family metallo-hydrolase n=1 Tax=Streptomyces sp. NPDC058691 TaxID=3346601 RepID=UPI0036491434
MAEPMDELLARAVLLREQAMRRLETLVNAESPSGDAGRIDVVNRELEAAYTAVGARAERVPGADGDHLVCHWPGGPERSGAEHAGSGDGHILMIGHSDTVFPAGTTAERPFRLEPDGDTVTGPGVFDMKGSLVEVELAMRLLADTGSRPFRPVRLVVVNDEEIGSPDGRRLVAEHAEGAVAVLGLEAPLPGGALKTGRRGVARIRIDVEGVSVHAGLDAALGVSAIDELVDQLTALRAAVPAPPAAELNVGTVQGGTRANVVSGHARAELGLRFADQEAETAALAAVESLVPIRAGARISTTRLSHRPAWADDPANPLAAELIRLAGALGLEPGTGTSGGAGDTNHTGAAGIPTADGLGPEGGGAHSVTEHASVRSLLHRAALLAAYLGGHAAAAADKENS